MLEYNSVVLQEGDHLTFQSTAIAKLIFTLDGYKWLAALLWLVPKPLRNLGYQLFADNRDKMWKTTWAKANAYEQSFLNKPRFLQKNNSTCKNPDNGCNGYRGYFHFCLCWH